MKFTEFYLELQGRPSVKQSIDPGTGIPTSMSNYVLREEFTTMQTDLKEQLGEQTTVLEQALIELRQIKMHLASLSDEVIEPGDGED